MKTANLLLAMLMLMLVSGCAAISKETLKQVDENLTLDVVQARPDDYTGKKVVWGGTILSTEHLENMTEIEVLESNLSYDYTPKDGVSRGRFIIQSPKFLDENIYKQGKKITIAGTIKGVETRKIGKMNYPYALITPIEMKILEPPPPSDFYGYPPYSMYGPYTPYYPYSYPYPYPHPYYPGPSWPYRGYPYWPYPP